MATPPRSESPATAATRRLEALRGNCMGAAVLLIVEFALGVGVNLYLTRPAHQAFFATLFGSATLAAHAILAVLLLGAAIGALVRAVRSGRVVALASVGLAAVVSAGVAGAVFVSSQDNGASLGMALAAAIAMFCYLAAIFGLR